ncbi:class I SAM-dependent methyltransferase [Candidatus Poribacteria bacterium]|jgi:SAM-dependent methyltransferase|nr:class I SAM-dependent methyltransferase [Candidatus Poribacteria bacterium]MBT5531955.1 class I SAM-dependent methyltransferase [Candidatus Poribacteria bacterium]MBT5710285.1 class I SAM-dependent methyltransferase [Candidatus Poribacteria bacterium]MBT7101296.1 class I SAM-dependent methyltransferase [Candidatus Poribacteria bacterium]MBT7809235.1 class I SAM-dependent methyltransferase [Candidatus Poribacteria bacterium]
MHQSHALTGRLFGYVQELAESYKNHSALQQYGQVARDQWIRAVAAALPATATVLDVGAGETPYRDDFSHCQYKTQDFAQYDSASDPSAQNPWKYGDIDYVCDLTDIPVPDGSFDVVICTEVLEHVPEPIRAIAELSRILADGGRLYLSAPMRSAVHQAPHHYYGGFTPYFYQEFLPRYGFTLDSIVAPGGLFKGFQEECFRVGDACLTMRKDKRDDVLNHIINFVFYVLFPHIFTKLDERHKHDAFAAGWQVEATKQTRPSS